MRSQTTLARALALLSLTAALSVAALWPQPALAGRSGHRLRHLGGPVVAPHRRAPARVVSASPAPSVQVGRAPARPSSRTGHAAAPAAGGAGRAPSRQLQ